MRAARRSEPALRTLPVRHVVRDGQDAAVVRLGDASGRVGASGLVVLVLVRRDPG